MTRSQALKKKNELAQLKAEVEFLRTVREPPNKIKPSCHKFSIKVSEKGACSVYGLGRFPITLYQEQWRTILEKSGEIRKFLKENEEFLKSKDSPKGTHS